MRNVNCACATAAMWQDWYSFITLLFRKADLPNIQSASKLAPDGGERSGQLPGDVGRREGVLRGCAVALRGVQARTLFSPGQKCFTALL